MWYIPPFQSCIYPVLTCAHRVPHTAVLHGLCSRLSQLYAVGWKNQVHELEFELPVEHFDWASSCITGLAESVGGLCGEWQSVPILCECARVVVCVSATGMWVNACWCIYTHAHIKKSSSRYNRLFYIPWGGGGTKAGHPQWQHVKWSNRNKGCKIHLFLYQGCQVHT